MQRSYEGLIYICNKKKYAYISIAKSKTIVVFAFTCESKSFALLYGVFAWIHIELTVIVPN
jgi:hypothetical protein